MVLWEISATVNITGKETLQWVYKTLVVGIETPDYILMMFWLLEKMWPLSFQRTKFEVL